MYFCKCNNLEYVKCQCNNKGEYVNYEKRTCPGSGVLWIFRSASLMSVRNGRDQRSRALEWSAVISLAFCGLVEWSAVGPAERSLRREDGRTADTAGMGGRDLKVRTAAVESTVG